MQWRRIYYKKKRQKKNLKINLQKISRRNQEGGGKGRIEHNENTSTLVPALVEGRIQERERCLEGRKIEGTEKNKEQRVRK